MDMETKLKNRYFYDHTFLRALNVVAGNCRRFNQFNREWEGYEGRPWFKRETKRYEMHPCIQYVMFDLAYKPHDWHQLLLEYPHRSTSDYNRIAYTRDDAAGEADRQVVTTVGKYLTRHFPDMPDHIVRDVVALHTACGTMTLWSSMHDIVRAAIEGPKSCMSANFNIVCKDGQTRHPYEVYDPALGWRMAVRLNGTSIDGRALVYCCPTTGDKMFVRSYKRDHGGGYSYADEMLEAWLKAQGIPKTDNWSDINARMRYYEVASGDFLMPYLDGSDHRVCVATYDGTTYVIAEDDGDFCADSTSGTAEAAGEQCEDCGCREHADDMYWVGPWEDRHVCSGCIDSYRYCYGRRGNQYYQHEDNVVYVESMDEYYDEDYLSDNNIVELVNGDYEHLDNAVEVDGDWYHNEDSDICYDEYNDRYQLASNCVCSEDMGMVHHDDAWQCADSQLWYTDNIEHVEVDDERYHPDHAPESAQNELFNNDETN